MTKEQKNKLLKLREEGYGYGEISKELGISKSTISSFISRQNTKTKIVEAKKVCKNCGKEIINISGKKPKKFCCDRCRNEWWNSHMDQVNKKAYYESVCACCGKQMVSYGNKKSKYCSHECYIKSRFYVKRDNNE